jgi:dynactin complex subunit
VSKEKIFQLEKKEICITSSQIKQAIDLLVNENEILQEEIERLNNIINEIEKEVTTLTLGSMYAGDTKVEKVLWHLGKKIEGLKNNLKEE